MDPDKISNLELDVKKAEIKKLTQDIIELGCDIKKNKAELKEKMRNVISLVSTLISYPDTNPETYRNPLSAFAVNVFELLDKHPEEKDTIMTYLKLFGDFANNLSDAVILRKEAEK